DDADHGPGLPDGGAVLERGALRRPARRSCPALQLLEGESMRRLIVLLAASLGACSYTTTSHVVTGTPGPARGGEIRIVMSGVEAPAGFAEVAILQAVGVGGNADLPHLVRGLKAEAAALGCDVVINVKIDQGATAASATGVAGRFTEAERVN